MKSNTSHHRDTPPNSPSREKDFLDLFDVWSGEELKAFNGQVDDFEKIDPADWE